MSSQRSGQLRTLNHNDQLIQAYKTGSTATIIIILSGAESFRQIEELYCEYGIPSVQHKMQRPKYTAST